MSSQFSFKGVATALVTPMQIADGAVDERALRALVDFQISNGVNGLVPCGTTGESATLNHAEHHHVMDIVVEQAAGRVPVIVGAGSNSTREAVSLTQHARAIGANAVSRSRRITTSLPKRVSISIIRAIVEAVDIPIFV